MSAENQNLIRALRKLEDTTEKLAKALDFLGKQIAEMNRLSRALQEAQKEKVADAEH